MKAVLNEDFINCLKYQASESVIDCSGMHSRELQTSFFQAVLTNFKLEKLTK